MADQMTATPGTKRKSKAKRSLTNIDFTGDTAHVALVSQSVNSGPANGVANALVLKGTKTNTEFVQKMQQIQVTLEVPEFLEKFFGVWGTDAEVLARLMGYDPDMDEANGEDDNDEDDWYEAYVQAKLSSFTVMKSLKDSENIALALTKLSEDDQLALRQDQASIEKSVISAEKLLNKVTKGKQMPKANTEVVVDTKAGDLEVVQKALEAQTAELQKALATVAAFEAERKEAVQKSKTSKVEEILKSSEFTQAILKGALLLDGEDFDAFAGALTALVEKGAASDLFVEKGATVGDTEPAPAESLVAKVIKERQNKTK